MKLVVGFGNPESKYNFTRHNFGFLTLDFYAKTHNLAWEKSPKFNAIWAKTGQSIFIKPQTYYNEIGNSIRDFAKFYKITHKDILVICDDFDLDFSKIRFRENGSAGGNNGLKSTIKQLGTSDFPRLRLGTDSKARAKSGGVISDIDFVLSKFTPEEKEQLPNILNDACTKIDAWLN